MPRSWPCTSPGAKSSGVHPDIEAAAAEDPWLVEKARQGNLQAFELLVHRHRDRIFRIAWRMLGDRHDAEDVTQDVVVQLWTGLAAFYGHSSFTTWLHRVVINRCLNRMRVVSPTPVPESGEPGHPVTADVGERAENRAQLASAAQAVAGLPPELRAVFVCCQLEGLSYREVAAARGVSEDVVRGRLARARVALAHAMKGWT